MAQVKQDQLVGGVKDSLRLHHGGAVPSHSQADGIRDRFAGHGDALFGLSAISPVEWQCQILHSFELAL